MAKVIAYEILKGKIFQSAKTQNMTSFEEKKFFMQQHGISIVMNLWHTVDEDIKKLAKYYFHVSIPDGKSNPTDILLPYARKIAKLITEGEVLLSHCYGGKNRSALFNAMVLIELGKSKRKAIEIVKKGRPSSFINENFVEFILNPKHEKQLSLIEIIGQKE